jgi:Secretion system C-terminal sorting domain
MRTLFPLVFLLLIIQLDGLSQRRVIVPEGFGTLNEIIRKDTIAGGARKDPNTIYVLRRGGVYILSGTILTSGFTLSLEAEKGTGPRPYVVMGFLEGGTQVEECFEVRGNVSFRSIHLTAINELNTYVARVLSASSPNLRISLHDCLVDGSGQTFLRINSPGCKVYMINTTISRMGRPSNPDNGRIIDDRGNQIDSVVVENNTWYNVTSRIIRDGGSEIKYVKLNQNTFVNVGQRLAAVGPVNQLIFTNNVIVNPRFLGNSATSPIVSLEFSPTGANPVINLNNNNIYYDAEVLNAWQTIRDAGLSRLEPPFVVAANQSFLNSAVGILREPLNFTTRPTPPSAFILESELGSGSSIADWDWAGPNNSKPWEFNGLAYHNFSYPTNAASFTGSSKGEPLGDLRWFPNYEVAGTVIDLAKQAQQLIAREQNNPVIGSNATALSALQAAIANALTVSANAASSGIQLATARNTLQQAMNAFQASLIITALENEQPVIELFPNPVADNLTIKTSSSSLSVVLLSSNGQEIERANAFGAELTLSLHHLSQGLYLVRVQTPAGVYVKKIIKL